MPMAFTPQDLAAVDAAIASGELTVRGADDRQVTYRTIDELLKARALIQPRLAAATAATGAGARQYPRHQLADFSD